MSNKTVTIKKFITSYSTKEIPPEIAKFFNKKAVNPIKKRQHVCESFQRKACWDVTDKRLYIDSLYKKMALATIVMADIRECLEHSETVGDKKSVQYYQKLKDQKYTTISIDGQNRTNALVEFILNEFTINTDEFIDSSDNVHPPMNNVFFKDLPPAMKADFNNLELNLTLVTDKRHQDLTTVFQRLQCGLPLEPQEKRNGIFTPIAGWSRSITKKYSVMFEMLFREPKLLRMKDRELASKMALALEKGGELQQRDLDDYYKLGEGTDDLSEHYDEKLLNSRVEYLFDNLTKSFRENQKSYPIPNFWMFCLSLDYFTNKGYKLKNPYRFKVLLDKRIESLTRQSRAQQAADEEAFNRGDAASFESTAYFHARKNRTHYSADRNSMLAEVLNEWKEVDSDNIFHRNLKNPSQLGTTQDK